MRITVFRRRDVYIGVELEINDVKSEATVSPVRRFLLKSWPFVVAFTGGVLSHLFVIWVLFG